MASSQPTAAPAASSTPGLRACVTERATIVERGEQLELWYVRHNDAWVRVGDHPAATVESEADTEDESAAHGADTSTCPTGTVWQRKTELVLPRGTRLRQRQTWPRVRQLSVMGYLTRGIANPGRVMREREFSLSGNYRLTPVGRLRIATEGAPADTREATNSRTLR